MTKEINADDCGQAAGRDVVNNQSTVIPVDFANKKRGVIQTINGNANIVAGGNLHITTERIIHKTRPIVTSGVGVISEDEKVRLKELLYEWVAVHNAIKHRQLTHVSAWSQLNRHGGVTAYALTPAEKFKSQEKWLQQKIATLRSMRSAPKKDAAWRTSRIRGIKTRSKNQLGDEYAYLAYIKKNFCVESLVDLGDEELQKTYLYIMGKKSKPLPPE